MVLLTFTILFSGCSSPFQRKKPTDYYYTNLLAKNFALQSTYRIHIVDTAFYKDKVVSKDDLQTVKNFVKSIKTSYFIKKPVNLPTKPLYKIYVKFAKDTYIINVYDEKYISVYPWDGVYAMDYIDMSSIYHAYNLYYLCKYYISR